MEASNNTRFPECIVLTQILRNAQVYKWGSRYLLSKIFPLVNLLCQIIWNRFSSVIMMNNSKLRMSWGRSGASSRSHSSSDPILNRDITRQKARITDKKFIVSRIMNRLFQPRPQKPMGGLPEGLKGFFEPVAARSVITASPVEIIRHRPSENGTTWWQNQSSTRAFSGLHPISVDISPPRLILISRRQASITQASQISRRNKLKEVLREELRREELRPGL